MPGSEVSIRLEVIRTTVTLTPPIAQSCNGVLESSITVQETMVIAITECKTIRSTPSETVPLTSSATSLESEANDDGSNKKAILGLITPA